jgi:subtilisin-like proprotein convertase family protein
MTTPTDPLYDDQWHFDLIGDIETIWDDYTGDGVTVAVYDEGVDYDHPDLDDNYDASMHFTYDGVVYDGAPNGPNNGHGTSCAGLIGAENNGEGGVGVAYDVTITGVDYLEDIQFAEQDVYDAALYWAANFDIMSNSWGYSTGFTNFQNLNTDSSTAHDVAIYTEVVATGRDGAGTIILKAAGNETKNANGDGMNASHVVITVAATEQTGEVAYYSNYGSTILIAAPASGVTTDMTGEDGYNGTGDSDPFPVDYTSEFNGTSAATPTAAGVVALMLEADPTLGWRDVKNILALSASHTGSDFGGPAVQFEVGSWDTMGGNTWNGGGTQFHQSYGYGMVDAYTAVRFTEAWDVLYAAQGPQTSANEQVVTAASAGGTVAIPDNNGVPGTGTASVQVVSNQDITIESIHVTIDVTHSNSNDLIFYLMAPDGQMVELYNADGNGRTMDNGLVWTFNVEGLRGYSSEGTWTVVAEDTVTGGIGEIDGVDLTFYGSTASNNDVYHFTDDFFMLADFEASRTLLDDTNGGIDWLNFSAIAGDVVATMVAGGAISIGGVAALTLAAGAADFENFYSGDGDDVIDGNSLGNHIVGARGVDNLHGKNGNDRLVGEDGNDTLFGDKNNDTLTGGDGNDRVNGGTGSDNLSGNGGNDTFIFQNNFDNDTVQGFQDDLDTLRFNSDFADGLTVSQFIATYATVVGGNTVFDFGGGDVLTVVGVTNTSILTNDITFI